MYRFNIPFLLKALTSFLILSATACAWLPGDKDKTNLSESKLTKQSVIEVPSRLSMPDFEDLYQVPDAQNIVNSSNLNDNLDLQAPLPIAVIWGDQKVVLKENKRNAWLTVKAPVEDVWEILLAFWAKEHIPLSTPLDIKRGIMITQWFNKAVFNDNPKRIEKVKLEISPSENESVSNITLTYIIKKAEEKPPLESAEIDWTEHSSIFAANQTKLFLMPLKTYLIDNLDKEKTISLLEQTAKATPLSITQIHKTDDSAVLIIQQDFNFAWATVEDAVSSAKLQVSDVDRSKGQIYLQLISKGTKSKLLKRLEKQRLQGIPAETKNLVLHMTKQKNSSQVSVKNEQGQAVAYPIAEFVLRLLVKQIGKSQ